MVPAERVGSPGASLARSRRLPLVSRSARRYPIRRFLCNTFPKVKPGELELLPFEDALRQALEPAPDYDVTRWLYVPKVYGEYRYVLGTRGKHPLICMGINPSTAIPDRLDNTLKSVERIALQTASTAS